MIIDVNDGDAIVAMALQLFGAYCCIIYEAKAAILLSIGMVARMGGQSVRKLVLAFSREIDGLSNHSCRMRLCNTR